MNFRILCPFLAALLLLTLSACPGPPRPMKPGDRTPGEAMEDSDRAMNRQYELLEKDQSRRPASSKPSKGARLPVQVEMMWKVPKEDVLAYHLYVGTTPSSLQKYARIPVADLERLVDDKYGPVYRYMLTTNSQVPELYVSLQAENKDGVSPQSRVLRVPVQVSN